ncbi:MAG: MFS transporter, partial [Chloroflexota bacterium]
FALMMVTTHVMPYLEHTGYSRSTASVVAMMIPVLSMVGRLGGGWVSDYLSHRLLFLLLIVGQAAGLALFSYANLPFLLVPFLVVYGISYGGIVVLRPAALGSYFGNRHIGGLLGLCLGITQFGSIIGPLLAGWIFDTTRNYSPAWLVSGVLLVLGIPLVAFALRKPAK